MYIKRLVLENLRGFERLDFSFGRPGGKYAGWTVVTGDNASGKTSLLKAIAAALVGPDAIRSLQPSFSGWVRKDAKEATIAVEIETGEKDHFVTAGRAYSKPFWSELSLRENGGPEVSLAPGSRYKGKGRGPVRGPWADNPDGWFCVGYGPFRRLYGASPEAQRVMSGPSRVARFATMFREDATLGECEIWLKELHHKQLERSDREGTILDSVLRLIREDYLQSGVSVERVDSEGLWLRHRNGIVLPLADMSEGYRAALAMLIDLLRHVVSVYPDTPLIENRDNKVVVPHQGVVLIDEIDSHLHPEWQRRIGFWLKEKLPNIQFIVTTHSPIICQAADEKGLFHLPPSGGPDKPLQISDEDYKRIIKEQPNAIYLSPAFGMRHVRSPKAVQARQRYAELRARESAVGLSPDEKREKQMYLPFTDIDLEGQPDAQD
ncbi:MAG: AAA family ATPase [Phycisphaerae bacterium]|nr:AAA family ATPase [Phycisphaerae bacterium]